MTKPLRAVLLAASLMAVAPAAAQYTAPPQPEDMQFRQAEVFKHVARINLGVGFYNNGWYNCYYGYYYGTCSSGSYTSFIPFLVGAQLDFNLEGINNISAGFTANIGTVTASYFNAAGISVSTSKNVTVWEPTLDYVAKLGRPTEETVGRFRVGAGMLIGPNGGLGGVARLGGGASFLNNKRFGIGLDAVFEAGSYEGYWVAGLQLLASPEVHF